MVSPSIHISPAIENGDRTLKWNGLQPLERFYRVGNGHIRRRQRLPSDERPNSAEKKLDVLNGVVSLDLLEKNPTSAVQKDERSFRLLISEARITLLCALYQYIIYKVFASGDWPSSRHVSGARFGSLWSGRKHQFPLTQSEARGTKLPVNHLPHLWRTRWATHLMTILLRLQTLQAIFGYSLLPYAPHLLV